MSDSFKEHTSSYTNLYRFAVHESNSYKANSTIKSKNILHACKTFVQDLYPTDKVELRQYTTSNSLISEQITTAANVQGYFGTTTEWCIEARTIERYGVQQNVEVIWVDGYEDRYLILSGWVYDVEAAELIQKKNLTISDIDTLRNI